MSVEVAQATPDRLPAVASTIGRALVTEPMLRWPLGVDADLEARSIRNFEHYLEPLIELGIVWATADTLGAAVWVPPARTEAFEDAQRKSQPSIDALTDDRGRRFSVFWRWIGSMLPDEPLWYLDLIGVAPEAQGRGVGSALIELGLTQARAEGTAAFLETGTPGNVAYYERFGFRVVHDADAPDGGPQSGSCAATREASPTTAPPFASVTGSLLGSPGNPERVRFARCASLPVRDSR